MWTEIGLVLDLFGVLFIAYGTRAFADGVRYNISDEQIEESVRKRRAARRQGSRPVTVSPIAMEMPTVEAIVYSRRAIKRGLVLVVLGFIMQLIGSSPFLRDLLTIVRFGIRNLVVEIVTLRAGWTPIAIGLVFGAGVAAIWFWWRKAPRMVIAKARIVELNRQPGIVRYGDMTPDAVRAAIEFDVEGKGAESADWVTSILGGSGRVDPVKVVEGQNGAVVRVSILLTPEPRNRTLGVSLVGLQYDGAVAAHATIDANTLNANQGPFFQYRRGTVLWHRFLERLHGWPWRHWSWKPGARRQDPILYNAIHSITARKSKR